jgi:hypothetical protein
MADTVATDVRAKRATSVIVAKAILPCRRLF